MKQLYFLFLAFLISSLSWGQILLSDNFNYADETELSTQGWTVHSAANNRLKVGTSNGLSYTGYLSTVPAGNAASLLTGNTGDDINKSFNGVSAGNLYATFLVNVSSASTTGDYVAHFGPNPIGTSFRGRFFVKKEADPSNKIAFGIQFSSSGSTQYTGYSYDYGTTYLVVLKIEIVIGTSNDKSAIIINPAIQTTEPPVNDWVYATDTNTDFTYATFSLRQGGTSTTPALSIDGLRVTDVWPFSLSDATLNVVKDDILGFSLYPNPVKGGKVFINSANPYAERTVQVFDVLGKQVVNQKGTQNSVDVSHLNKGIYIMKVDEEGKVATRKLVIE